MKTTNILELIKDEELNSLASMLLNNGFNIMTMNFCTTRLGKSGLTHFTFTDGKGFGYIQQYYSGYALSSEYKPSKNNGSGCRYNDDPIHPTLEDFNKCMWSKLHGHNQTPVEYYKDMDDFLKTKERSGSREVLIQRQEIKEPKAV